MWVRLAFKQLDKKYFLGVKQIPDIRRKNIAAYNNNYGNI